MTWLHAFILAVIEGLTEFLPISSTGHLIIASSLMGIEHDPFVKSFNIIVQTGAILSVLVLYWRRFLPNLEFYKKLIIAFLPAAVIGLAVKSKIDLLLDSVEVVAWALIVGGFVLIWMDRHLAGRRDQVKTVDSLSVMDCVKLGFFQCLAFVPGVSRSGATILGGLMLKMTRREAAEFSFFLAVPTLAGAGLIKTLPLLKTIEAGQVGILLFGMVVAFVVAILAIRFFIALVSKGGFTAFGLYRIVLGLGLLAMIYLF